MRTRFIYLFSSVLLAAASGACGDDGKAIGADAATCTPVNDNNACTTDVCENNVPVHNPVAAGSACTGGTCDAAGTCVQAVCGDGTVQAGEMCDDGNKTNDDGCDDGAGGTCRPTGCGNGVKTGTEACDDGNATNGDGCDNNCKVTACGNGVTTAGETCDDGNTAASDGCNTTCQTEAGYSCTAAVPSVCTQLCGNNVVDAGEACDDGNRISLDGCSANCRLEAAEVEPNEDGATSTGGSGTVGNDFDTGGLAVTNATNQGVILASAGSVNRLAAIDPAGDEDVFAISNDTTGPVELRVDIWNRATGFGFGVPCGASLDTGLNIRDAAGVILVKNDDRNGSIDPCSGVTYMLAAGAVVYAHVVEYGDNAAVPSYGVAIVFTPVVCGDARVIAGFEECDDGNTMANDGCNAMCKIEGTTETEPNEDGTPSTGGSGIGGNDFDAGGLAVTNATNQGVRDIAMGGRTWLAAITAAGDEDVFAITNGGVVPYEVAINVWDPTDGIGNPCTTIDTGLNVRDAAGVVLFSNDDRRTGDRCSGLTLVLAAGQTRYLHVTEYGDNETIAKYALEVVRREVMCGDGHIVAGIEACDDGNTTAADGCSATCTVEANYTCVGEPSVCTLPPYASTTLACLDMTGATEVQPAGDDDEYTATAALPFSFNLYGTTMTHFATSSNGFAAFFANAAGSITSSSASNASTVPDTGNPNGYLAPFWDDLVLKNTGLRSKLSGAAGTRIFTLEWNAELYAYSGSNIVVQLQIDEAGGVEYHYCSGTGDAAAIAGSEATVAAENATGTVGHAFSIDAESITQGTTALRWVFP